MRPLGSKFRLLATALLTLLALVGTLQADSAFAHGEDLTDEPLIPGLDEATDFAIAGNGDVYVAQHNGTITRYRRTASSTVAYPRYDIANPQLIYKFQTTVQNDRGLVGITLDSAFDSGQRYLYAIYTRGSREFVTDVSPNPNGIRRTGLLVKIAVPASGAAQASDVTTILGKDAPADADSTCRPYTKGQATAYGKPDADPDTVGLFYPLDQNNQPNLFAAKNPLFSEANIYPDGDLTTRGDGSYDCLSSDSDTHFLGAIQSAPDGSLLLSVGDGIPWQDAQAAGLRTYNQESLNGKVLRIDRNGKGMATHPFCPTETDLTRTCTKIYLMGLRNAFRFSLLPPDAKSNGAPVLALGDVGDFSVERLAIAHPGVNLGWPCWEGTYFNFRYASPNTATAPKTAWGGPATVPVGGVSSPTHTSCERLTATGDGHGGNVQPSADVTMPNLDYAHDQGLESDNAAVMAGPQLVAKAGSDPEVALPSDWTGSLFLGDFVRGWIYRLAPDASDPANTDSDGGLRLPADEGRGPRVRTDEIPGSPVDPLLDRVAEPPPGGAAWYRLTEREGPDGTLWYARYGGSSQGGAIYRLRHAPAATAAIDQADGLCTRQVAGNGDVTLSADDAGAGATYGWDIDGDGNPDSGRTARTTTILKADLNTTARDVRLFVTLGSGKSASSCYLGQGTPPDVSITSPANNAQVVLGQPVVVSATRAPGDAAATGIPDSALNWKSVTVHGSSHEHTLLNRESPFETVGGVQKMQFTVVPAQDHELGSYTRVRIFAPQSDANNATQTIRLYPKPVQVGLKSSPAGATMSFTRDVGRSVVDAAPGSVQMAAGYTTILEAGPSFKDGAGATWTFDRWSDGSTALARKYTVAASSGDAPVAQYVKQPEPTTPTTPDPTTPGPTTPAPIPAAPIAATPIALIPLPKPVVLPPTQLELKTTPVAVLTAGRGKRFTVKASMKFARTIDGAGYTVKAALRARDCQWWSFSHKRFQGKAGKGKQCTKVPSWKAVSTTWTTSSVVAKARLGKALPRGRYALRLEILRGKTVVANRVHALVVK